MMQSGSGLYCRYIQVTGITDHASDYSHLHSCILLGECDEVGLRMRREQVQVEAREVQSEFRADDMVFVADMTQRQ